MSEKAKKITKIVAWVYLVLLVFFPTAWFLWHEVSDKFGFVLVYDLKILPLVSLALLILGSMAWKDKPRSRFISIITVINYILFLPIMYVFLFAFFAGLD